MKSGQLTELSPYDDEVKLVFSSRGVIDNLEFRKLEKKKPKAGEVEIQVYASGLNFRDVLNVMDMYPGDPGELGGECSGIITTVGLGVTEFKVGDSVLAQLDGGLRTSVIAPVVFVAHKPKSLSFEGAAGVPGIFFTVHCALRHLAKLKRGDQVLIHAAAGGVGMVALQMAKLAGAEIFATAGSPEKRELVKQLGCSSCDGF